jgi:hypothetical protein
MSEVLGGFGCWISTCYSPFSLGGHFETCELFISFIFTFWWGHSKPRILNQQTQARLYKYKNQKNLSYLFQSLTSKNSYRLKPTRIYTSNLYLLCVLFCIHGSHYINCVMHVSKKFGIVGFKTTFKSLYVALQSVSHLLKLWIKVFKQLKVLH